MNDITGAATQPLCNIEQHYSPHSLKTEPVDQWAEHEFELFIRSKDSKKWIQPGLLIKFTLNLYKLDEASFKPPTFDEI